MFFKKIFFKSYYKNRKIRYVMTEQIVFTQYQFWQSLKSSSKQTISLRYIYWAKSATLTGKNPFRKILQNRKFPFKKIFLNCEQLRLSRKSPNPFYTNLKKKSCWWKKILINNLLFFSLCDIISNGCDAPTVWLRRAKS